MTATLPAPAPVAAPPTPPGDWMAIAFNGHREYVGVVREATFAGATLIHVEALQRDGTFEAWEYGAHALYSRKVITEEVARRAVLPEQTWSSCDTFKQPSARPGFCASCGRSEAAHHPAKALPPPQPIQDEETTDDDPLCETCGEPVPDDHTRVFCAEDSTYFHGSCFHEAFAFDVEAAVARLHVELKNYDVGLRGRAEAAIDGVGIRDEHDMDLLLHALGFGTGTSTFVKVMGESADAKEQGDEASPC